MVEYLPTVYKARDTNTETEEGGRERAKEGNRGGEGTKLGQWEQTETEESH